MATFTNETINTASLVNESISTSGILAVAGQVMGLLLALTYSGGQITSTSLPVFTNETIN